MYILLIVLAFGAAIGTFLENDYGNTYAKQVIYTSWWYQSLLLLSSINLILIFLHSKLNLLRPGPIFHFAFILILIGAFITHHFGLDGLMHIREGQKAKTFTVENRIIHLPFSITLKDFNLERYPGSRSPSQFSSDVIVTDDIKNTSFKANIYMNNTLNYGGYKFFQTSYDEDEKGTVLTVNKDPGVIITYLGYAFLFLGLILILFDKKSRIRFLIKKIKNMPIAFILWFIALFFSLSSSYGQNDQITYIENYLDEHLKESVDLAKEFGTLIVQGPDGRMKPLNSQNREVLYKLTGKSTWHGMNADQVAIGLLTRPEIWKKVNLIRVKTPKFRKLLGVPKNQKLVAFNTFFDANGNFKFTKEVEKANQLSSSKRGTFERDLIQVDELLNIAFMTYRGMLFKVFPKPNDPNNTWVNFPNMLMSFDNEELQKTTYTFFDKTYDRKYNDALKNLKYIKDYQYENGKSIIPNQSRVNAEIWYNQIGLFIKLSLAYLILGFALVFFSLYSMLNNKLVKPGLHKMIIGIAIILFLLHFFGIGLRWYIAGFAPLSNTYETMIYIALSTVLTSLLFIRNSLIGFGGALIVAGVFIFSAYLGEINPQITNLVPVLKSYWLLIHVAVITASYGFLGVSAILGFLTLILYLLHNSKRKYLKQHIINLTYINEATIIFGVILLTIGNFLGAIWANESWGRYWGWDPKETWTYISIIIYTIILHFRLIKKIYSPYWFGVGSVLAYFSILMTYYGVNYYLSGMHSYATGDPIPIPYWIYFMAGTIFTLIILTYKKRIFRL